MESTLPDAERHAAILLVEDESAIRELMASYLSELGYHVLAASDGGEALAHIEGQSDFELLLTDIVLPGGLSGFVLAERARICRPEVKVLYVSGHLRDEDVESWKRDSGRTFTGNPAKRSVNVSRCCLTSSVVGTSIATCLPSWMALNAARTATSVLP